jgi:hypothetical protein
MRKAESRKIRFDHLKMKLGIIVFEKLTETKKRLLLYRAIAKVNAIDETQGRKIEFLLNGEHGIKPDVRALTVAASHDCQFNMMLAATDQQTREDALIMAISCTMSPNYLKIMEKFLGVINPNFIGKGGETPLMIVARYSNSHALGMVLQKMDECREGAYLEGVVEVLQGCGLTDDIIESILPDFLVVGKNSRGSNNNMTALECAVSVGQVGSVKVLIADSVIRSALDYRCVDKILGMVSSCYATSSLYRCGRIVVSAALCINAWIEENSNNNGENPYNLTKKLDKIIDINRGELDDNTKCVLANLHTKLENLGYLPPKQVKNTEAVAVEYIAETAQYKAAGLDAEL